MEGGGELLDQSTWPFFLATQLEMLARGNSAFLHKKRSVLFFKRRWRQPWGDTEDVKGHEILYRASYVSLVNLMKEMIAV